MAKMTHCGEIRWDWLAQLANVRRRLDHTPTMLHWDTQLCAPPPCERHRRAHAAISILLQTGAQRFDGSATFNKKNHTNKQTDKQTNKQNKTNQKKQKQTNNKQTNKQNKQTNKQNKTNQKTTTTKKQTNKQNKQTNKTNKAKNNRNKNNEKQQRKCVTPSTCPMLAVRSYYQKYRRRWMDSLQHVAFDFFGCVITPHRLESHIALARRKRELVARQAHGQGQQAQGQGGVRRRAPWQPGTLGGHFQCRQRRQRSRGSGNSAKLCLLRQLQDLSTHRTH